MVGRGSRRKRAIESVVDRSVFAQRHGRDTIGRPSEAVCHSRLQNCQQSIIDHRRGSCTIGAAFARLKCESLATRLLTLDRNDAGSPTAILPAPVSALNAAPMPWAWEAASSVVTMSDCRAGLTRCSVGMPNVDCQAGILAMRRSVVMAFGLLAGLWLRLPAANAQKPTLPDGATAIASLPGGFSEQIVATGITGATAMAIAPDGRVFVCEQTGALRVVKNDKLLDEPFLTLSVDSSWERGLIGVAFDPGFPTKPYIYVCYVAPKPYPHHRVSRFTAKGDVAEAGSEVVLLSGDDQSKLGGSVPNGHQGGALHFGKDRKLYIGIGEQTAGLPAQKLDTLQGKLLRINPDGSIPDDNPFAKTATGKYRAIWAYGLRNPFAFAVQPGSGRIFIDDVGEARWEEIDEGIAGANYGWPLAEGMSSDPKFRNPIHAYDHGVGRCISGGAFYNPPHEQFPKEFVGKYFFADFMDNWIRTLDPERPKDVRLFATGLVGPVDMQVAPNGSLYYLNRNAWVKDDKFKPNTGSLHRISYTANSTNPAPIFTTQPEDRTVEVGQSATFTVAAKGDSPLHYQWLRGTVPIKDATSASYTVPAATATDQGANFRCVVSNARGSTKSRPAAIWVASLARPSIPVPWFTGWSLPATKVIGSRCLASMNCGDKDGQCRDDRSLAANPQ